MHSKHLSLEANIPNNSCQEAIIVVCQLLHRKVHLTTRGTGALHVQDNGILLTANRRPVERSCSQGISYASRAWRDMKSMFNPFASVQWISKIRANQWISCTSRTCPAFRGQLCSVATTCRRLTSALLLWTNWTNEPFKPRISQDPIFATRQCTFQHTDSQVFTLHFQHLSTIPKECRTNCEWPQDHDIIHLKQDQKSCLWLDCVSTFKQTGILSTSSFGLLCFPREVHTFRTLQAILSHLSMLQCRKSWVGRNLTRMVRCGSKMYKKKGDFLLQSPGLSGVNGHARDMATHYWRKAKDNWQTAIAPTGDYLALAAFVKVRDWLPDQLCLYRCGWLFK